MLGGGLGPYAPGEWSDDTQMAVCVAQVAASGLALASPEGLDAVAAAFVTWLTGGATDVGNLTRHVLAATSTQHHPGRSRLPRPGSPASLSLLMRRVAEDASKGGAAGNGALMRTSIVGVVHLDDRDATARAAAAVAALTHADPLCIDSAVLWSEAVRVAVVERRVDLRGGLDLIPDMTRRRRWTDWIGQAEDGPASQFTPNGFTVTALQAAWASVLTATAHHPEPSPAMFEHGVQTAVSIGDDTDTVAAIAAGLLGALVGARGIPAHYRAMVHGWPSLTGDDLVDLAARIVQPHRT
jgi:ADP-ribosyl-[dinitrogen reductase] hydrolase